MAAMEKGRSKEYKTMFFTPLHSEPQVFAFGEPPGRLFGEEGEYDRHKHVAGKF